MWVRAKYVQKKMNYDMLITRILRRFNKYFGHIATSE